MIFNLGSSEKIFFFNKFKDLKRQNISLVLYKEKVGKNLDSVYYIKHKEDKSIITEPDISIAPIWKDN